MSSLLCLLFARCLYACWYLSYAGYALQVNINTHFYSVRAVSLTTVMGSGHQVRGDEHARTSCGWQLAAEEGS